MPGEDSETPLTDAMGDALIDRHRPPAADASIHVLADLAIKVAGSVKGAAALFGVHRATFARWRTKGVTPKGGTVPLVRALRTAMLPPAKERQIKGKQLNLVLIGSVVVSNDTRTRKLAVGRSFPLGTMTRIINLWKAGEDKKAEKALNSAISKYYLDGFSFDRLDGAQFE